MSHKSAKMHGHNAAYCRGHGRPGGQLDGRLAYDIVEAALTIRHEEVRLARQADEKAKRAKIVAITLPKMPWD